MATLTFRVPDEVATRFAAHARCQGGRSAVLRRLVDEAVGALEAAPANDAGSALPAISAAFGPSTKVTLRLREEEITQIVELAEGRGMNRTQWITSLVRARLGVEHPQTGDERVALRAIARELNRIGGNVNQIARAANTDARSNRPVSVDVGSLADLSAAVDEATAALRQALGRSAGYWDTRS
ncbi:plasmid mobilization relaxosome protein MobC (plasmid) [Methylobacterium sp. NMS12]|uniref:plasmid mobilization protein n=1 Tax=Methylobacterium sp. NMS12 TaxID=3079766 RepID=UPI003F88385F